MSEFNPEPILESAFTRLRNSSFKLGVSEYLAAVDAVKAGMGSDSLDALRLVLKLLWCHSQDEQAYFSCIWEEITASAAKLPVKSSPEKFREEGLPKPLESTAEDIPPPSSDLPPPQVDRTHQLTPLPVRSPYTPIDLENPPQLLSYLPISRRSMAYTWRYLRRPIANGPADILDTEATVEQVARQGFFLAAVYRRREVNQACLLLLIDRDGSMIPFHRLNRELVETVDEGSTIPEIQVYYFHNVPVDCLYEDANLTQPVPIAEVLAGCHRDTSVLIVSDAGAARGYRQMHRIRATVKFLVQLKQRTNLIGWLNPMPRNRWEGTSAESIGYLIPMEPMDKEGFGNAIDIVRGQTISYLYNQ
jgi:uncharacterized protein